MLPDNFDFAMLPELPNSGSISLREIGMLESTIEDIDYAITSWLKNDLNLYSNTNEGRKQVPVLWQTPERAFQVKNEKESLILFVNYFNSILLFLFILTCSR